MELLIYKVIFIKDIKPSLNTQSDSIRSKLFLINCEFSLGLLGIF